jgi:hypothetical protein
VKAGIRHHAGGALQFEVQAPDIAVGVVSVQTLLPGLPFRTHGPSLFTAAKEQVLPECWQAHLLPGGIIRFACLGLNRQRHRFADRLMSQFDLEVRFAPDSIAPGLLCVPFWFRRWSVVE